MSTINLTGVDPYRWCSATTRVSIKKRGVASDAPFLALTRRGKSPLAGKSPLVGFPRFPEFPGNPGRSPRLSPLVNPQQSCFAENQKYKNINSSWLIGVPSFSNIKEPFCGREVYKQVNLQGKSFGKGYVLETLYSLTINFANVYSRTSLTTINFASVYSRTSLTTIKIRLIDRY